MYRIKNLLGLVAASLLVGTATLHAQPVELVGITNSIWKYSNDNSDQYAAGFPNVDDSAWLESRGLFGNDGGYPYPFIVQFNGTGGTPPGPQTAYYRIRFNWASSPSGVILTMTNFLDDAMVLYLNGVEIHRTNITDSPVLHTSGAPGTISEGTARVYQLNLDALPNGNPNPLLTGQNILAASVHQTVVNSSDHVFGLSVYGSQAIGPCAPPAPANITAVECRNATFNLVIPANCGIPTPTIQWFRNVSGSDEEITGQTGTSLTLSNLVVGNSGQYFARLTNPSGSADSGRAQLTVMQDIEPPQIVSFVFVGGPNNEFLVTFNEPVQDAGGATDSFGMSIIPVTPAAPIGIISAVRDANDFRVVRLTTDMPLTTGVAYTYEFAKFEGVIGVCDNTPSGLNLTGQVLQNATLLHWTDNRNWRYNQSGADQGTAWKEIVFDDSTWDLGPQGFGNEGAGFPDAPDSQRTPLTRSATQITYYFRTTFTVPDGAQNVRVSARVDDGAAIYVNGTEVGRVNIAANLPLFFNTLTPNLFDPENTGYSPADGILISSNLLVSGDNVLAIEVHQNATGSSDVIMLAVIQAYVGAIVVEAPEITQDPVSTTVTEGHSFRLTAAATGTSPTYQWYKVGTPDTAIPGATASAYTAVADSTSGGGYYVIASNSADSDTSATATVTLRPVVATYGAVWKYETNSQDATLAGGTPWFATGFDDSAWPSGPGPLGVEPGGTGAGRLPAPIATALPPPNTTFLTAYFRTTVTVPALSGGQSLVLTHLIDDGVAFYVDGVLALRYNLTNDPPILSTAVTPGTVPGDGEANLISVPVTLSPGVHTIAAEVHQNAATSSDIVFGAELRVISSTAPALTITRTPPAGVQLTWTANPLYSLFQSTDVAGPYTHILANPQGVHNVVNATNPAVFFRIGFNGQ